MAGASSVAPVRTRRQAWLGAALVVALAAGTFAPTLRYPFVSDDLNLVPGTVAIAERGGLGAVVRAPFEPDPRMRLGYYRPAVLLSIALDARRGGGAPRAFHLTNVLLHAAASLLVLLLLANLGLQPLPALLGAALFAVHPVHAESVAFVSGRTDLIAGVFALAAAVLWLRVRAGRSPRAAGEMALAALACLVAILAKEAALLLPVLLFALDFVLPPAPGEGRSRARRRLAWALAWGAAVAAALLVRLLAAGRGFGLAQRAADGLPAPWAEPGVVAAAWAKYLSLLVLPWPAVVYYTRELVRPDATTAAGLAAFLGLLALAWRARRREAAAALLWIGAFLLPVSGVLPIGGAVIAERFLYLPSVGFSLLVACALERLPAAARRAAPVAGALICAALAIAAGERSALWKDNLGHFSAMVRRAPGLALARAGLGDALREAGRHGEAAGEYRAAAALAPGDGGILVRLGNSEAQLGRTAEATEAYRRAIAVDPRDALAHANLGITYAESGRYEAAAAEYRALVGLDPGLAAELGARIAEGRSR